jgi:hypothetical protein
MLEVVITTAEGLGHQGYIVFDALTNITLAAEFGTRDPPTETLVGVLPRRKDNLHLGVVSVSGGCWGFCWRDLK